MSPRSSVVEHFLGKEEVAGSIPAVGSITFQDKGASRIGGVTDQGDPPPDAAADHSRRR